MLKAIAKIPFKDKESTNIAFKSLLPEIKRESFKRSKSIIKIKENCLLLIVVAKDKNALKASLNSYIKLAMLSKNIQEVITTWQQNKALQNKKKPLQNLQRRDNS